MGGRWLGCQRIASPLRIPTEPSQGEGPNIPVKEKQSTILALKQGREKSRSGGNSF